jgi:hypothetical protein
LVHSTLVRINEKVLERKVAATVEKNDINDRGGIRWVGGWVGGWID